MKNKKMKNGRTSNKLNDLVRFALWADREFGIMCDFQGNGCPHGFKPAEDCPNKDCEHAEMSRILNLIYQSNASGETEERSQNER